jgi:hypothetical protein
LLFYSYADSSGAANDVYDFVSFGFLCMVCQEFFFPCFLAESSICVHQVKKIGKFKETKRTDGVSTSDLIMRILKDYNQYIMRNLTRGYSRKDLGVSYVKVILISSITLFGVFMEILMYSCEYFLEKNMGFMALSVLKTNLPCPFLVDTGETTSS